MTGTTNGFCTRHIKRDIEKELAEYLGAKYGMYRSAWNAAGPENVPEFPIHIDLELIDSCNQNCSFCPRNRKTHPELPYEINTKAKMSAC